MPENKVKPGFQGSLDSEKGAGPTPEDRGWEVGLNLFTATTSGSPT